MLRFAEPLLVRVTVFGSLSVPTISSSNETVEADKVAVGEPAVIMPPPHETRRRTPHRASAECLLLRSFIVDVCGHEECAREDTDQEIKSRAPPHSKKATSARLQI